MYGCVSWTIKKAECWRIDAFELWCWRRLLWVPWTARRSNQSILKESVLGVHWKDWCWSWNSNTLATWCEALTHLKRSLCWERLGTGGEGDNRGWDGWMTSPTQWTWLWINSRSLWLTGKPSLLLFMCLQRVRHDWVTELNWSLSFNFLYALSSKQSSTWWCHLWMSFLLIYLLSQVCMCSQCSVMSNSLQLHGL